MRSANSYRIPRAQLVISSSRPNSAANPSDVYQLNSENGHQTVNAMNTRSNQKPTKFHSHSPANAINNAKSPINSEINSTFDYNNNELFSGPYIYISSPIYPLCEPVRGTVILHSLQSQQHRTEIEQIQIRLWERITVQCSKGMKKKETLIISVQPELVIEPVSSGKTRIWEWNFEFLLDSDMSTTLRVNHVMTSLQGGSSITESVKCKRAFFLDAQLELKIISQSTFQIHRLKRVSRARELSITHEKTQNAHSQQVGSTSSRPIEQIEDSRWSSTIPLKTKKGKQLFEMTISLPHSRHYKPSESITVKISGQSKHMRKFASIQAELVRKWTVPELDFSDEEKFDSPVSSQFNGRGKERQCTIQLPSLDKNILSTCHTSLFHVVYMLRIHGEIHKRHNVTISVPIVIGRQRELNASEEKLFQDSEFGGISSQVEPLSNDSCRLQ